MGSGPSKGTGPTYLEVMANAAERERAKKAAVAEGAADGAGGAGGSGVSDKTETAIFAAGCFWGVELAFQRIPGVHSTAVGYIGGKVAKPTYKAVCTGSTGHTEALRIIFDPDIVTFRELISVFWERHDPTTLNRQGNDAGTQYRSGVWCTNAEQRAVAEETRAVVQERLGDKKVVTEINDVPEGAPTTATTFYEAEDYHQQYLEKGGQTARKGDTSTIRCYG